MRGDAAAARPSLRLSPLRQAASVQHGGPHAPTPAASSWGRRARFCVSVFRDNQATVEM